MALVWGFSSQNIVAQRDIREIFYYSLVCGDVIYGTGFNITSILTVKKGGTFLVCEYMWCVHICDTGSNTHNVKYTYTVFLL